MLTTEEDAAIVLKMHQSVDQAFAFARQSDYPQAHEALQDVFVQGHSHARALA